MTKKDQKNVKPATPATDIFAPIDPAAFDRAVAEDDAARRDNFANSPLGNSEVAARIAAEDHAAQAEARKQIEQDAAQHSGVDNTPIDITTGEPVTTGFFMDLTKDDGFELIAQGTRALVSCVAAEAVVSTAGNPMLNLRVKIERVKAAPDMSKAPMYRNRSVKDRLMFIPPNLETGSRGTIWRARLAFQAFDIAFDARAFRTQAEFMEWLQAKAELFIGSVAEITIGVDDGTSGGTKQAQINPETGEPYPPKNTIAQYFKMAATPDTGASTGDLPF